MNPRTPKFSLACLLAVGQALFSVFSLFDEAASLLTLK
jgi:hypothetical protein